MQASQSASSAPAPAEVEARALLERYLPAVVLSSPTTALALGLPVEPGLDLIDAEARADQRIARARLAGELTAVDPRGLDEATALDRDVALLGLRRAALLDERMRVAERVPYWYPEALGGVVERELGSAAEPVERGARLAAQLAAVPAWLAQAERTLEARLAGVWIDSALASATGLTRLVAQGVDELAPDLPDSLASELRTASRAADEAIDAFAVALRSRERDETSWSAGREYFDATLAQVQLVGLDSDELAAYGAELVERDRTALERLAREIDRERDWNEILDGIKDDCPPEEAFIGTYEDAMRIAREQTLEHAILTIPEGEDCVMGTVPEYRRFQIPIAVMDLSAPFADGLTTQWSITPADPSASATARLQHRRDNCYAFAASIASHETYPGHHLQRVHHKLATVESPIRRSFVSPQLLEGWGLYIEDVFDELGLFPSPAVRLYKLRNALWRSLRIVIDVGIHTGRLGFDEAVDLLEREARLDRHMAVGEVRRYARHDNPTYPSSYVLGRDRLRSLRDRWLPPRRGAALRDYHDAVLGFGTLPLAVIESRMLAPAA